MKLNFVFKKRYFIVGNVKPSKTMNDFLKNLYKCLVEVCTTVVNVCIKPYISVECLGVYS